MTPLPSRAGIFFALRPPAGLRRPAGVALPGRVVRLLAVRVGRFRGRRRPCRLCFRASGPSCLRLASGGLSHGFSRIPAPCGFSRGFPVLRLSSECASFPLLFAAACHGCPLRFPGIFFSLIPVPRLSSAWAARFFRRFPAMACAASGGRFLSLPFPCGDSLLKAGWYARLLRPFPSVPLLVSLAFFTLLPLLPGHCVALIISRCSRPAGGPYFLVRLNLLSGIVPP